MSKHTPGPWALQVDEEIIYSQGADFEPQIAITYKREANLDGLLEERANARLIAAAPELLGALKALIKFGLCENEQVWADALSAIAKAEGRESD